MNCDPRIAFKPMGLEQVGDLGGTPVDVTPRHLCRGTRRRIEHFDRALVSCAKSALKLSKQVCIHKLL
jgi:hypothetical protein